MGKIFKVGLSVRVNGSIANRLSKLGVEVRPQSHEQVAARTVARLNEGLGSVNGVRTDAAGNKQADSGRKVWGDNGLILGSVSRILQDFKVAGYVLENIFLQPKDGDRMYQLKLWYAPGAQSSEVGSLPEVAAEIQKILDVPHEHVHGYENPDGTGTLNLSHRVDGPPKGKVKFIRFAPDKGFTYAT